MRLAAVAVLFALVSACLAEDVKKEAAPAEAPAVPAKEKSSRAADAPVYQRAQNRDGAHHHHHEHHPISTGAYAQPAPAAYDAAPAAPAYAQPAPVAYEAAPAAPAYAAAPAAPAYEAAPAAYEAAPAAPAYAPAPAAPAYEAAPAAPAYDAAPAPAYSTPGHQGYYYYYYPVKDTKAKLKLPKLPKLPSLPSLRLPEYIGKDGGAYTTVRSYGAAAAAVAAVVAGVVLSLPIIGIGASRRSFSSLWENEYLTRENMNVLAEFILNTIDNYKPDHQN